MTQLHRFALLSALLVSLAACNVYDAALIEEEDAGAEDSGTDADTSTGACGRRPPERPTGVQDGDDDEVRLFALENIVLEQLGDVWRDIGFDIDGYCTNDAMSDVECLPAFEVAKIQDGGTPSVPLDGMDGIDNVLGSTFFPLVDVGIATSSVLRPYWMAQEISQPKFQTFAREEQRRGTGTVLLRVSKWNGEDDDPRVTTEIVQSAFGTPCNTNGSAPEIEYVDGEPRLMGGDPLPDPAWEGNDCWWIHPDSFAPGGTAARLTDTNAWVSGGKLVFRMPDGRPINFYAGVLGVKLILTDSVFSVELTKTGGENLIVTGRWGLNDLMEAGPGVGVCADDPLKLTLDDQLARMADVLAVRPMADTQTGRAVECSAISMGVKFERLVPGTWVETAPSGPELPNPCVNPPVVETDAGVDPDPDAGT